MLFNDTYKTISNPCQGIFSDRGSKFIANGFPIKSDEGVKKLLAIVKTEHPKARHHCWAMRLSPDRSIFKLNDDGEPSGTAGRPILNTLLSFDVTNILIVVTRYFGGTLLGVPGLINAYKSATINALNNCQIISRTLYDVYRLDFKYDQMNAVMKILKDEDLIVSNQLFDNVCSLDIEIRKLIINTIIGKLNKVESLKLTYLNSS